MRFTLVNIKEKLTDDYKMASTNIANQLTSTTTCPNLPPPAEEEQIGNRCIGLRGEHYVVFIFCATEKRSIRAAKSGKLFHGAETTE